MELDEGMLQWGLRAAAMRVSFLPCRAGLGSAIMENNPDLRTVVSPYDGEELVAMPALPLDVALLHANRADWRGNAQYLGPDWYFDDVFAMAAQRTLHVLRAGRRHRRSSPTSASEQTIKVSRLWTDGVVEAPYGAHFTHCVPDYPRDEAVQREYAGVRQRPRRVGGVPRPMGRRPRGRLPAARRSVPGRCPVSDAPTLAEVCVVACAEAFRGDGEILASPIGIIPALGARLAALPSSPISSTPTATPSSSARPSPSATTPPPSSSRPGCRSGRCSTSCGRGDAT